MRALKVLVVVMGVLIVAGTVTLATLLVQRMSAAVPRAGTPVAGAPVAGVRVDGALGQPGGSRIAAMAGAGERLAVWVVRPDGERVLLLDPRTGTIAAELRLGE